MVTKIVNLRLNIQFRPNKKLKYLFKKTAPVQFLDYFIFSYEILKRNLTLKLQSSTIQIEPFIKF